MSNTALVTGASTGIGAELARAHAKAGGDLVLAARSLDRLEALKSELESAHGVKVAVFAADLSLAGSAQALFEQTEAAGLQIDILMNNAGFGGHGKFHERDLGEDESMIQLNVSTLTSLTHLYLQGMVERRSGKVLNVASTAGFMPGPLQAVYYATKAFVLSFSQAIAEELSGTGVTVTALCPGPVQTEFAARGNLEGLSVFKNAPTADAVARCGYQAMLKGKLVVIDDPKLSLMLNWVTPWIPRRVLLKLSRQAMEKG